jgi:3-oxoacyl-[acyl-carrier protein] reductase
MKLQNKTALVTGASRGIGRAIALRLAREGASIVVHYKSNENAAQDVVREIEGSGGKALAIQAGIADLYEVRRMFGEIEGAVRRIDILVNNAGWAEYKPLEQVSEDDFDTIFDLNVRGLFFVTQEAVRLMPDNGRIVSLSSGITRANVANGSVYSGSKAAVEAFTRCWAAELGPRGITVNTVSPGMVVTDLLNEAIPTDVQQSFMRQTPLGRLGLPEDIADVVAFLCSDDGRWLTAQNILANGGMG